MRIVIENRIDAPRVIVVLVPIASVAMALVFGGILMSIVGADPIETYAAMAEGAFGSPEQWKVGQYYSITETLVKAIPLMLTGLAVGVAFRMLFWNIGAEGQLVLGGVSASAVALWMGDLIPGIPDSAWVYLPMMAIAGIIAGGIWAVVPALLKAYLKVNEIITTLMLNYVAILWYQYLFNVAWKDPAGYGFPGSAKFGECCKIARISGRLHWGLAVAFISALIMWIILDKTKWGYQIRLIGENVSAARYAGINIGKNIVGVMLLSGGLAGLAGMVEVAGISHSLQEGLNVGYGFTAIIISWLARLNPWGIVLVANMFAAILVGGDQIQMTMGLPGSVAHVLQGAMLFCVLGGEFFQRYRLTVKR
tara:strand:+ start:11087 stop:12181 length:1095 start_codon:yes stop_codon:yes gene_type:complete